MRTILLALTTALLTATVLVGTAPAEARSLFLSVKRLSTTELVVSTNCPNDPPETLFITGTVSGTSQLLGSAPITCDGSTQRVVLPLNQTLAPRSTLTDVQVTVSGDSGEINAFYSSLRVHR